MTTNGAISPVEGRYITIEVDEVRYRVFYFERGGGRPLVCQHTAGCHSHQWTDLLGDDEFTNRYRVIAYDLPRHGKSDPPENRERWKEKYRLTVDHDLRGRLGEIDTTGCPLVMMTGNYDWATTPEDSERAARQIPGAEFIEMTGLGHFPMAENYPVFRTYLAQALELIEEKNPATTPLAAHSDSGGGAR